MCPCPTSARTPANASIVTAPASRTAPVVIAPASLAGTDVGGFVFGAMGETALSTFGNCLEFSTVCKTGKGRGGLCQKNRIPPRRITPTTPPNKPYSQAGLDLGLGPGVGITLVPGGCVANEPTDFTSSAPTFCESNTPTVRARCSRCCSRGGVNASSQWTELMKYSNDSSGATSSMRTGMIVTPLLTARSTSRLIWGESFALAEKTRTITRQLLRA